MPWSSKPEPECLDSPGHSRHRVAECGKNRVKVSWINDLFHSRILHSGCSRQAGNTFTKAQSHATASDHQCGRARSCNGSSWGPGSNTRCSLVSRERLFRRAGALRDQPRLRQLRDTADVHLILGLSGALVWVDLAALRISSRPVRRGALAAGLHGSWLCLWSTCRRLLLSYVSRGLRNGTLRRSDCPAATDRCLCALSWPWPWSLRPLIGVASLLVFVFFVWIAPSVWLCWSDPDTTDAAGVRPSPRVVGLFCLRHPAVTN